MFRFLPTHVAPWMLLVAVGMSDDFTDNVSKEEAQVSVLVAEPGAETPTGAIAPELSESGAELIRQRYPNGAIQVMKQVVQDEQGNYVAHGDWRMYDRSGNVVIEGVMREGKKEGPWSRVADSVAQQRLARDFPGFRPPFHSDVSFEEGETNGAWMMQDAAGKPLFRLSLQNGLRDGECVWYHPNGQQKLLVTYKEGVADGAFRHWSDNGELLKETDFVDGREAIVKTEYYDAVAKKQKRIEQHMLSRRRTLESPDDWWNSKPATYAPNGAEVTHGPTLNWHPNGVLQRQVEYRWGERHGAATWWYANGQVKVQGKFANGREEGQWTWWHENGAKKAEGFFENGRAVRTWQAWLNNGLLKSKLTDPYLQSEPEQFSVLNITPAGPGYAPAPMIADDDDPVPPLPETVTPMSDPVGPRWADRRAEDPEGSDSPGAIELDPPGIIRR